MTTTVHRPDELLGLVGGELGTSDRIEIDQERIDRFAAATDDDQWIHTDPQRAADGPFGGTIAHGFPTLSLLIPMIEQILVVEQKSSSTNYGLDCTIEIAGADRPACVARAIHRHMA